MNALQKAKLLKQLKEVNDAKATLSGVAKAKALKTIMELRNQLGLTSNAKKTKEITYDLGSSNRGGGLSVYARNVQKNGDYATLVTLSGVNDVSDGMRIDLKMNEGFTDQNTITQVKEYLRDMAQGVTFSDEPEVEQPQSFADDDLYSKDQVKEAFTAIDKDGDYSNGEVNKIIGWAIKKGFVIKNSVTQIHWTEKGIEWLNTGNSQQNSDDKDEVFIRYFGKDSHTLFSDEYKITQNKLKVLGESKNNTDDSTEKRQASREMDALAKILRSQAGMMEDAISAAYYILTSEDDKQISYFDSYRKLFPNVYDQLLKILNLDEDALTGTDFKSFVRKDASRTGHKVTATLQAGNYSVPKSLSKNKEWVSFYQREELIDVHFAIFEKDESSEKFVTAYQFDATIGWLRINSESIEAITKLNTDAERFFKRQNGGDLSEGSEIQGNAYFQSVISGERTLSIETLQGMLNEAEQNPEDVLLVPATQVLVDQYNAALV